MAFPYIPPRSELDSVRPEELTLFLEAAARKTDAYKELRRMILRKWTEPHPILQLDAWLQRWNLANFDDYELNQHIRGWTFELLDWWKREPAMAASLRVDHWRSLRNALAPDSNDSEPTPIAWTHYNSNRESWEQYERRKRQAFECLLAKEKSAAQAKMSRYGLQETKRRERTRNPLIDYEWLALAVCKNRSAREIAIQYFGEQNQLRNAERVKKALQSLYQRGFVQRSGEVS